MYNIKNLIKQFFLVFGISFFAKEKVDLFNKNLRLILFGEISDHFKSYDFNFYKNSKSQIMQDYFVACYLKFKKNGLFIEFGATDGIKDSNTYNLEKEIHNRFNPQELIVEFDNIISSSANYENYNFTDFFHKHYKEGTVSKNLNFLFTPVTVTKNWISNLF